jgi:hypothetical protein
MMMNRFDQFAFVHSFLSLCISPDCSACIWTAQPSAADGRIINGNRQAYHQNTLIPYEIELTIKTA